MKGRLLLALAIGLGVAAIIALLEITTALGAHPHWRTQLFLSGAGLGTLLALIITQFGFVPRTIGLSILVIGAYVTADYGKARFAASFAEDAVAGQMWFYGWHALAIGFIAHVSSTAYERLTPA